MRTLKNRLVFFIPSGALPELLVTLSLRSNVMQSLSLQTSDATESSSPDPMQEVARLEALLAERRAALTALQEDLRAFKTLYARTVGHLLSELEEIERAIKAAEAQRLGIKREDETEGSEDRAAFDAPSNAKPVAASLRKLFWSVARMFHPDHAQDEASARHRHTVMAEASRAYREGDIDSLHSLLGDEQLQFYCAAASTSDDEDFATRLLNLKEELRTVEFGIKRAKQESLYRLKQKVDEEAAAGRDALASQSERLRRHIVKARRRLEHLS